MLLLARSSRILSSTRSLLARNIFINTESTPNPNSIKFLPGKEVLPESYGTGREFQSVSKREIQCSPLAKSLFEIDGINGVYLGRDFISVTKANEFQWSTLKPQVFSTIFDFFSENKPVILDTPIVSDTAILETDDEVVATIKELLETKIRPYVQEDGGDIFYVKFDEENGFVHVRLAGSCVGCPSSSITLRNGVENMLMHYIPEVKGIIEVSSLAGGGETDTECTTHDYSDKGSERGLKFSPTTSASGEVVNNN